MTYPSFAGRHRHRGDAREDAEMTALRAFRHPGPSLADLVPYAALVVNVILLKDGSLMAGWYFAGPDSESSTDAECNEVARQISPVLSRRGSG